MTRVSRDKENTTILSIQGRKKQKNVFLGHFWSSEGYTYFRPPIVNHVLQPFLGANQYSTTSSPPDMNFGQFLDFWTL